MSNREVGFSIKVARLNGLVKKYIFVLRIVPMGFKQILGTLVTAIAPFFSVHIHVLSVEF